MNNRSQCFFSFGWTLALWAGFGVPAAGQVGDGLAPERVGTLDESIRESSGLALSWERPGWLWTHGDSGAGPNLARLEPATGETQHFRLAGVPNKDWEDLASFERGGESWLLVADTGDNLRDRTDQTLYLVREPAADADPGEPLAAARAIGFRFEDGPRDCEAVAVEPGGDAVWLVSKEINAHGKVYGFAGVYRLDLSAAWGRADAWPEEPTVLPRLATLDSRIPTAVDIAPDGRSLMICTYADGLLFRLTGDEAWDQVVARPPQRVSLPPRRQGEGLCFAADGASVFLSSEKPGQPIWRVALPRDTP